MDKKRKKIFMIFYIVLISFVVLVAVSYAWMTMSSTPTVSDLALALVSDNALELAPDIGGVPGNWGSLIDLSDLPEEKTVLRPITFSAEKFAFLAPKYGLDGRPYFSEPNVLADLNKDRFFSSSAAEEDEKDGYLLCYDFWMRTEVSNCYVSLSDVAERISEEIGSGTFFVGEPVWNEETILHENQGNGAEYAIRVGFLIDVPSSDTKKSTETQSLITSSSPETTAEPAVSEEITSASTAETQKPAEVADDEEEIKDKVKEKIFVIYEPNADGGKGKNTTYSVDGSEKLLEGNYKIISQNSTTFSEVDPVLWDTVEYTVGEFTSEDQVLFELYGGEERHITIFVWLEGQDADCTNIISEGRIFGNVQFTAVLSDEHEIRPDHKDDNTNE